MNCGIYKIINLVTGDFYIGQSTILDKRKKTHWWELRTNRHANKHLQNTWNKYGEENFKLEIILYCEPFELTRYEQALVDKWKPHYNICKECVDSKKGVKFSEESIKKLSDASLGNKYALGYRHSEETKRKMSKERTGQNNNNYGKHPSNETIDKIKIGNNGKILSEETKRKMSKSHKEKPFSDEHRKNISKAKIKYYDGIKKITGDKLIYEGD